MASLVSSVFPVGVAVVTASVIQLIDMVSLPLVNTESLPV